MKDANTAPLTAMPTVPGVGTYVWRADRDMVQWSMSLCAIYGVETPPSDEQAFLALVHPEDRPRVEAAVTAFLERGDSYENQFRILRPDGTVRHILDKATVERDAEGRMRVLHGISVDVTDQAAIQAQEATARTFATLIEDAPFGVYAVDADFRITHASASARRAFAAVRPTIGADLGDALRVLWPDAFAAEATARFRHTLATGEPFRAPTLVEERADRGEVESYDWRLERVTMPDGRFGVVCHFYDLTDRHAEAQALREDEERVRLAGAAAGIGFWDVHLNTGRLEWSDEMYDLLGRERGGEASVDLFFEHVLKEDRDRARGAFERSITERTLFSEEFRIRRADGAVRHLVGRGRVMREEGAVPTRAIGVNYDVTERREAETALRAQAERLRALMDGVMALVGLLDAEGRLIEINQPTLELGGYRREDLLGRPPWETEWHTHDPESAAGYRDAILSAAGGEAKGGEVSVRMADGSLRDIQFLAAPFADNGPARVVLSGFDVTDRKRADEHVRDLMREMSHRAKNAYALVLAIAKQVQRHSPDDFFPRFSERVTALSVSHDLVLEAAGPEGAPLGDLIEAQLRPIDEGARRIETNGPDITLNPDAAQALGMVLHELGTNATKHGALSVPEGRVILGWEVTGGQFRIEWRERGGPPPRPPEHKGFGTLVLGKLTERSLNVTCESDWQAKGLCWTLKGDVERLLTD